MQKNLSGLILSACFSNNREELIFHFEGENKWQLTLKFAGGEMYFFCEPISVWPGKNAISQFRQLENARVESVIPTIGDRSFQILFHNQYRMFFKGFGKFGNILLYGDEINPVGTFRRELKVDADKCLASFEVQTAEPIFPLETPKSLKTVFPWYTSEISDWLKTQDFYSQDAQGQQDTIQQLNKKLDEAKLGIDNSVDPPALLFLSNAPIGKGMPALEEYAKQHLRRFYYLHERELRLQAAKQKLKHLQKLLNEQKKRLHELETRRSYKELGDIILTYAHSIKPGVANAFLTDYFTGNQIRVKLDPTLSAPENAQKYYRKAKNEIIEKQKLASDLEKTTLAIETQQHLITAIESTSSIKDFKGHLGKSTQAEKPAESKPYKLNECGGYEIWVGKQAKGNDAMLKLANKNDMWLHARGVAGSHVIVRKKGTDFPDKVIEYAAKLAALNSKAKTQKIVPVYCVERKFVTKPKKALPGEVTVLKEHVIDAVLD